MPVGKKREGEATQRWTQSLPHCLHPSPALQHGAGVKEFAFPEASGKAAAWCGCVDAVGFVAVA